MQDEKCGNSLALKDGDALTGHIAGERVFDIEKKAGKAELLARLRALRGTIPSDLRFDRLEANEKFNNLS